MSVETIPNADQVVEVLEEQEFFDAAVVERERASAWKDPTNWSGGTAAERRGMQRIRDAKTAFSPEDPVAFGSITMEDGETHHVGLMPVFNEDREALVISWQTPIGALYNQATYRDPQGLSSKRAIEAPRNKVSSVMDTYFADVEAKVAALSGESKPDDALLKSLESSRDGAMSEIASTIQAAQDQIIRADKDQLLVVQGGPGTGKTAVALHRVSWLLYNFPDDLKPTDILVVGPNPTFTRYISKVLPSLGDDNVVQKALKDLLAPGTSATGVDSDEAAELKGSQLMIDLLSTALKDRVREPSVPVSIRLRNSGTSVELDHVAISERLQQLFRGTYSDGRSLFRDYLVELAGVARGNLAGTVTAEMFDTRSLDAATERIWPQLSAQQFLRDLLGSKERLLKASPKQFLASSIETLYRPSADKMSDEQWTLADLALLDEASVLLRGEPEKFGHIVVDEAQDLSEMQLAAIRRRSRTGAMTIVGDIAQSTGPHASEDWDITKTALSSNLPINEVTLERGYRVPREVFEVALPVLKAAAPTIVPPQIVRDSGVNPTFESVDQEQFYSRVVDVIREHSASGRSVGAIAQLDQWDGIRDELAARNSKWNESTSGGLGDAINLVTPEDAKGLEFDAVVVIDPQSILDLPRGERFLYIALTRTTTFMDIVYPTGRLPEILGSEPGNFEPQGSGDAADDPVELLPKPNLDSFTDETNEDLRGESTNDAPADEASQDLPVANDEPEAGNRAGERERRTAGAGKKLSGAALKSVESNARILLEELMDISPKKHWNAVLEELLKLVDEDD